MKRVRSETGEDVVAASDGAKAAALGLGTGPPTRLGEHETVQAMVTRSSDPHQDSRITGDVYKLTDAEKEQFFRDGYVQLAGVVTEEELAEIEKMYHQLINKELDIDFGRDYGDMSQPFDTPPEQFNMINVALPSHYHPAWRNNVFERRAKSIVDQLWPDGRMAYDYDQLLAKKPDRPGEFPWHQDMGYWWQHDTIDTRTATFSLALNDANVQNGCLRVVPGSQGSKKLRSHRPRNAHINKDDSGGVKEKAMVLEMAEDEPIHYLPVQRGGCTIHDEWIVHGSSGNASSDWRHTFVLAFRDPEMIAFERSKGFRHSYNDKEALEALRKTRMARDF